MNVGLGDLNAFVAVARAGGFRQAARAGSASASQLSDALRRLEAALGVRLLHRTTRSVVPTEAGQTLLAKLAPAMNEVEAALDAVNLFREKPAGTLRLNVPVSAVRLVLPSIVPAFLAAYPDIKLEVMADSNVTDIVQAGCDAGIRYDEKLQQDMIALPIGPRRQRFAIAAAPQLLAKLGEPAHPSALLGYPCITGRFGQGAPEPWEFEKDGELLKVEVTGPLTVNIGAAMDLAVDAAVAGSGVIQLFEQWLAPYLADGRLVPLLEPWWQWFSGPYLYYPGRRLVPAPLRAFIDFVKTQAPPV